MRPCHYRSVWVAMLEGAELRERENGDESNIQRDSGRCILDKRLSIALQNESTHEIKLSVYSLEGIIGSPCSSKLIEMSKTARIEVIVSQSDS